MGIYYAPVLLYLILVTGMMVFIVVVSHFIGRKELTDVQKIPYECGFDPAGPKEAYFPVKFYIIAMLFIVFDIEIVFFYPWAVIYKSLGLFGLVEMLIFILVLVLGLVYVIKKGALRWE